VEAYPSPEAVREEEFSPAYALRAESPLIIPSDDSYALDSAMRTPARVISYGATDDASVRVSDINFYEIEGRVAGMQARVNMKNEQGELLVKGSVGKTQLLPATAALAAGLASDIPLSEALEALKEYEPPPGRGRLLAGKNGSIIIDDSYNASPAAVEESLETLKIFPYARRRIAVLGDMLELGRYSVLEHERIAALAVDAADVVVAVGIRSRVFATAGRDASPKRADVMLFDDSRAAASALPAIVREGDVILIKGSQSIRTERIVESLLANPVDVIHLVRQEKRWKEKA
jgi:UDP-N-acetylmuramyl pentapeptide synthase